MQQEMQNQEFNIKQDPYNYMLRVLFNRWKPYIIRAISFDQDAGRPTYYSAFFKQLPITQKVLSQNLMELEQKTFDFVTSINYTGYFLCAKYAAAIMEAEHEADPEAMFDIVTLNSKSGLEGSNKNFAYAGSKFGGIGLTQSFALELCAYNIKVNAVCPGNFLDGPLWSDPVRGLFVQYLEAGKVPGAKTVADVRRYYEAKVPMNRGCLPVDVARAVMYCVEQKYETGQAIPVTGGQVMLN